MGEYKDASLWMRIAFFLCFLGFALTLFAWAGTGDLGEGALAVFVIALLGLLTSAILAVGLVLWDELKDNKIATIIFVVAAIVAGVTLVIGTAIYADSISFFGQNITYRVGMRLSLWVFGGACEIVAGICAILDLVKK